MAALLPMTATVRFHLSLNVADLARSVHFYRVLFGVEPAKLRNDYAKFELDDPALVLSLEPTARATGGPLNHLGFRMADSAALVSMQKRLEQAGIHSQREEGVECCYAKQTKFWVRDPDGTLWEIYTLDEDIEHRGAGQSLDAVLPSLLEANGLVKPTIWEHDLRREIPDVIPLADNSADEVLLRGSFNLPLPAASQERLIKEVYRVLKSGGRVFVHVLVGDRPLDGHPQLQGPAAVVQHVPIQSEPVRLLQRHGFREVRMLKFDAKPCFQQRGVSMRELQLEGWKDAKGGGRTVSVLYKGPFHQVTDDAGTTFPRGEWVQVPAAVANRLGASEGMEHFVQDNLIS